MKFLLFEDNIPKSAGSGGHVATFGLIQFLRERGDLHVVNVISDPAIDPLDGPGVTVFRRRAPGGALDRVKALMATDPKVVTEIDWDALRAAIKMDADRVIFGTARFLHLAGEVKNSYYIADNVEWELILAMTSNYRSPGLAKLDAKRLKALEAKGVAKVHRAAGFTRRDAQALAKLSGREIGAIPPILAPAGRAAKPREPFVFYPTNLQHPPNVDAMEWFIHHVWPHRKTDWTVVVTGAGDFAPYREAVPQINFPGFISREDLADHYDRAGLVINPTRTGSGFQIKLLEALSYGCRVVSTEFSNPLGPVIRSSDDPIEFAQLVDQTLGEEDAPSFDYPEFYRRNCEKMEQFLELGL